MRSGTARTSGWAFALVLAHVGIAQGVAAGVSPRVALVAAVLAIGALATSAVFVLAFSIADVLSPKERQTEASTWVTVATNAGNAMGTAVAGLVAAMGPAAPFVLAAGLTIGAAVIAVGVGRGRRR